MRTRLVPFVLLVFAAGVAMSAEPPVDAVEFAGHHYRVFDEVEALSWQGGRVACSRLGGTLAVVTTAAEADFIAELCDGRYLFLGASDRDTEGEWRWVDGTPWAYSRWMKGQPNDYGGEEDFLATYDGGDWVDVEGSGDDFWMPSGYICEWGRSNTGASAPGATADVVGGSNRAVRRVADPILEHLLTAVDQGALKLAARDFSAELKQSLPGDELAAVVARIEREHGAYVAHVYLGSLATHRRTTTLVLWKAQYERDDVLIRMTLEKRGGRAYVTGLWFE